MAVFRQLRDDAAVTGMARDPLLASPHLDGGQVLENYRRLREELDLLSRARV